MFRAPRARRLRRTAQCSMRRVCAVQGVAPGARWIHEASTSTRGALISTSLLSDVNRSGDAAIGMPSSVPFQRPVSVATALSLREQLRRHRLQPLTAQHVVGHLNHLVCQQLLTFITKSRGQGPVATGCDAVRDPCVRRARQRCPAAALATAGVLGPALVRVLQSCPAPPCRLVP